MKRAIKLMTSLAGESFSHKSGEIIEVSEAEAARHVRNQNAVYFDGTPPGRPADAPVIITSTDGALPQQMGDGIAAPDQELAAAKIDLTRKAGPHRPARA